jgi:hypothetical protein
VDRHCRDVIEELVEARPAEDPDVGRPAVAHVEADLDSLDFDGDDDDDDESELFDGDESPLFDEDDDEESPLFEESLFFGDSPFGAGPRLSVL